ncbi:MAG: Leucine carboxyl methyltransferase [Methanoregulaceae archaeon PtaU1.Bin059]|nr:MAG: Leucine carboxyl methyltransferase [Methanoregulaceae archaeon PtaB.Bin152]OPY38637.1 MAG: Leucine carboxyl methyltransferase [Methanoregulaceae archaeon PtaU1.Bin059]
MAGSLDLEPTAALVMAWAEDLYREGSAALFYSRLDLSAGTRLKDECDSVCPWYPEVMKNRKWFIRHLASEAVSGARGPCQVVILAAGKSPLALELLDCHPEKIAAIIETDIAGMEEKQEIYGAVAPRASKRIRCVHADIFDHRGTFGAILATGMYDPCRTTLVVFEGISYYVPPRVSLGILSLFTSRERKNTLILDSLLPCRFVREDRRYISRGIWGIIHRRCKFQDTVTYSPTEMEAMLISAGCREVCHHAMNEMELLRTGRNQYFPTVEHGWIRVSTGRI